VIGAGWLILPLLAYGVVVPIRGRRVPRRRLATITILFLYALGVTAITVFPIHRRPPGYWAGQPWWTVIHWVPFVVDAQSFLLNIVLFVPFGVLVPLVWSRLDTVRRLTGCALATSAAIELTQFVLGVTLGSRRTVDINDLICNTAGALLGLLMLHVALPHAADRTRFASGSAPDA
jgi:glycopeptide antibiotics resistance protein